MNYDLIVIGGGHAGIEAVNMGSSFGLNTALLTMPGVGIASAPCNPCIGGIGKGQVVREIDSLGGLMGRLADKAGIQYRVLNESKGFAVQSTRVQIDKDLYSQYADEMVSSLPSVSIIKEKVLRIWKESEMFHVETSGSENNSRTYRSKKVILTVGTFLNGKLHCGKTQTEGGREGSESSLKMQELFEGIRVLPQRFKTGTPARLDRATISYEKMEKQPSDERARNFHYQNSPFQRKSSQLDCYLTYTNEETMGIIRDNKEDSPMFNGQIQGMGARYCPSIEDKAYRYPDKNIHHVFVEPEGIDLETVYPSGISSSLPKEAQEQFIATIPGLEKAKIIQYGYAVEYDVIDTTQLDRTLMLKSCPGLYFAGQINGTSGYEEAAGQGLVAGLNASLDLLGKETIVPRRTNSYIGVMIEDLITNTRDEPYRLFTARAENRLYIREDNSFLRMYPYRTNFGLNLPIDEHLASMVSQFNILNSLISRTEYNGYFYEEEPFGLNEFLVSQERKLSLGEVLKLAWLNPVDVLVFILDREQVSINWDVVNTCAIGAKYEGYIERANQQYLKLAKLDNKKLDLPLILASDNVSFECKRRIEKISPETFGQLKRINGLRPASLAVIASGAY